MKFYKDVNTSEIFAFESDGSQDNLITSDMIALADNEIAETFLPTFSELERLRMERNFLLSETDWWASSDLTMTDDQREYRQALRDITETYSSLEDVVWPVKPE